MEILTDGQIAAAIEQCRPSRIAVAFLGADWETFTPDVAAIDFIVISPTIGTNPRAVADLVAQIGWDRVYFLEALHAKVYLGDRSGVVGSANLTSNGLAGDRLIELCVSVEDGADLARLGNELEQWRARAATAFPTQSAKEEKLGELRRLWSAAVVRSIVRTDDQSLDFRQFHLESDSQFYVVWYQTGKFKHSKSLKSIEHFIGQEVHFAASDAVAEDTWVLAWLVTANLRPDGRSVPSWVYIHEIHDNGIVDKGYDYPKCGIQRKDRDLPPEPFQLTAEVIDAFEQVIVRPELAEYFIQDEDCFIVSKSQAGLPLLIDLMRQELK